MIGFKLNKKILQRVKRLLDEWEVYYEDGWNNDEIEVEDRDAWRLEEAIEIAEGESVMDNYDQKT